MENFALMNVQSAVIPTTGVTNHRAVWGSGGIQTFVPHQQQALTMENSVRMSVFSVGRNISGVGDKKMVVGDTVHQRPCSLKILVTRTTNNFMQLLEIVTGTFSVGVINQ